MSPTHFTLLPQPGVFKAPSKLLELGEVEERASVQASKALAAKRLFYFVAVFKVSPNLSHLIYFLSMNLSPETVLSSAESGWGAGFEF